MDAGEPIAGDSVQPPRPTEPMICDVCGGPAFELRCKIVCQRCGYTRDCSDP